MANPLSGLFSDGGFVDRLGDQSNYLGALGAGLLAHRQNANNPIMGDPGALALAAAADQKRRDLEQEKAIEKQKKSATEQFLITQRGLAPELARMVSTGDPAILNAMLKDDKEASLINLGDGILYDPTTEEVFRPGDALEGGGMDPDLIKAEGGLREELTKLPAMKRFDEVDSSYKRIRSSAQADSGAGDIGIVFGYMKMLDPASTVREGEFATAENAAGIPEQVRNLWNRSLTGERLSPTQRAQMVKAADGLYKEEASTAREIIKQYERLAGEYQLDPNRVAVRKPQDYVPLQFPTEQLVAPQNDGIKPRGINQTRKGVPYTILGGPAL